MKHKTATLEGAMLDAAVALADGKEFEILPQEVWGDGYGITIVNARPVCRVGLDYYKPSLLWEHGGPIIERERITLFHGAWWEAGLFAEVTASYNTPSLVMDHKHTGPTPLIAAMRAYVASKLGDEVELPQTAASL